MNGTESIAIHPDLLDPARAVRDVDVPGATVFRRGKVRTVFEAGPDHFVIVASDRLSAYDSILPTPIPGKGALLSLISAFWMRTLASARPHHLVSDDPAAFPAPFAAHAGALRGRAQLVRRAARIDIECVVRGHLTGSGWKEYRSSGTVCGERLPAGLADGARLEPALFTPATKADTGTTRTSRSRAWASSSAGTRPPPCARAASRSTRKRAHTRGRAAWCWPTPSSSSA